MSIYRGNLKKQFYLAALLYDCIEDRNISSIKTILSEKAADTNLILPKKGISSFHLVIGCDPYDFALKVTALILQHGGNPNIRSDDGLTPVHIAAAWGRFELLRLLLSCGGDPEARDINYKTPLHYAYEENHVECLQLLRSFLPIKNDVIKREPEDCEAYSIKLDKLLINNGHVIGEYEFVQEYKPESISKKCNTLQLLPEATPKEYILSWFSKHVEATSLPQSVENSTAGVDSFESSFDESDDERYQKTPVKDNITFRKVYRKTRRVNSTKKSSNSATSGIEDDETIDYTAYIDAEDVCNDALQQTTYLDADEFTATDNFSKESGIMTLPSATRDISVVQPVHEDKSSDYLTCSTNSLNSFEKNVFEVTEDLTSLNISSDRSKSPQNERVVDAVETASNDLSFISVSEVYKYVDKDEGIVMYERRLLKSPSEYGESVKSGSFISKRSSLPESIEYDADTLRKELTLHGYIPGPITHTTKTVYLKKLHHLKKYPAAFQAEVQRQPKRVYSLELEKTLKDNTWYNDIASYKSLEGIVSKEFGNSDPSKKWREGNSKTSFTYLLLDPRITKNLPSRAEVLQPKEVWDTFLSAVFYVGKGKRSRPYQHLYDAANLWKQGKTAVDNKKLKNITDIWRDGCGVICLHVFLNTIPVEAYTREAAMISALKIENLTNKKAGDYYGVAGAWPQKQKRMLGVYLLYKAMMIFLNEGERQLCPDDIQ